MTKVACSIGSCTYNQRGVCYAGCVHVSEQGMMNEVFVCCNSYVSENTYHNSLESSREDDLTSDVVCLVGNCKHYQDSRCSLGNVHIGGSRETHTYIETMCTDFEKR